MLFFIKLLFLFFLIQYNIFAKQINYTNVFKNILLEYNITYDNLDAFKSGAICVPYEINKVFSKYAVGFSHSIYKKETAEQIALNGCQEMKKKLISYDCKCELIL
ncbi:MAG: hypothetical protein VX089_02050 [Pseudomonadota bacterium]|nr:hypothetical protein [Pseudomonadota bacterium]